MRRPGADFPRVEAASREQLRAWLAQNRERNESVWLVTRKKAAGAKHLPYAAIVEEALCFGWIDSLPRSLDAERSMRLLSPRRPGAAWSNANRERAERLIATGSIGDRNSDTGVTPRRRWPPRPRATNADIADKIVEAKKTNHCSAPNKKTIHSRRSRRDGEGAGRGGQDRTGDLLLPKQARFRCATPRRSS